MTLLWALSLFIKDASIVDIFWGTGFVIVGWAYFLMSDIVTSRHWLLMIIVTIWGLRLSLYLAKRNIGKGEDFRYQRWREEEAKRWWWLSYIFVYFYFKDSLCGLSQRHWQEHSSIPQHK